MYLEILYKQSAFKHAVTKSDIVWAFNTAKYDRILEGYDNKYLLLGFSTSGNLLEVMYNDLGEDKVSVFHAMPCRSALLPLLEQENN